MLETVLWTKFVGFTWKLHYLGLIKGFKNESDPKFNTRVMGVVTLPFFADQFTFHLVSQNNKPEYGKHKKVIHLIDLNKFGDKHRFFIRKLCDSMSFWYKNYYLCIMTVILKKRFNYSGTSAENWVSYSSLLQYNTLLMQ